MQVSVISGMTDPEVGTNKIFVAPIAVAVAPTFFIAPFLLYFLMEISQ